MTIVLPVLPPASPFTPSSRRSSPVPPSPVPVTLVRHGVRIHAAAAAVLAIMATALAVTPAGAQQCGPSPGGPPCETAGGVASLADPDGSDLTVGNPIHPITGNKYQEESDAPPLPGPLGLEIRRHFNASYAAAESAWGKGWTLSYDTRLYHQGRTLQIVQADGRRLIFSQPDGEEAGQEEATRADAVRPDPAAKQAVQTGRPCIAAAPGQGRLTIGPDGYRWDWPHYRELHFDRNGFLMEIRPRGGGVAEALRIARTPEGRIAAVTDPAGRRMTFGYDSNGYLSEISHPLGRWTYRVTAAGQVESAVAPDGVVRRYGYEDIGHPSRLTSITLAGSGRSEQLVGRWAYDSQGRATSYRQADGSEIRMAYELQPRELQRGGQQRREPHRPVSQRHEPQRSEPLRGTPEPARLAPAATQAVSVLTNALGGRTTYRASEIAGKWRVTEIRGPGCATCGPANVRMRYDQRAQLLARWNIGGGGYAYRRDAQGRVTRILAIAHADPGPQDFLDESRSVRRFEYPDDHTAWPSLVARPSVVAGREHRLLIRRDDRGNIIEFTETGYAPDISRLPVAGSVPIARSTRLRYQDVAGKRVLVEVDGALPNGPAGDPLDSDITRLAYDEGANFLRAVVSPGGGMRLLPSRDSGGRPTSLVLRDGYRETEERIVYDLAGNITESVLTGWLLDHRQARRRDTEVRLRMQRQYDQRGRLIRAVDAAGRVLHLQRNAAGRLVGVADARGYRSFLERDAEGRVRVARLYEPGADEPLRAAYFGRDAAGQLQSLLLPDGRQLHLHRDPSGRTAGFTDSDQVLRLAMASDTGGHPKQEPVSSLALSPDGRVRIDLPRPTFPDRSAGAGATLNGSGSIHVDDFGRVLIQDLPDHGARMTHFDEAGRPVESRDAEGAVIRHRYDAAGRLQETVMAGAGTVSYAYEGQLLVTVEEPAQSVRYRHDALGRIVQTSVTLPGLAHMPVRVGKAYDPYTGALTGMVLASGRSLRFDPGDPQDGGMPQRIGLRNALWTAIAATLHRWFPAAVDSSNVMGLLPEATIVRDIVVHPFDGLVGLAHGNGVRMTRRFDLAGRLTASRFAGAGPWFVGRLYGYGTGPRIRWIEEQEEPPPSGAGRAPRQRFDYDSFGALSPGAGGPDPVFRKADLRAESAGVFAMGEVERDRAGRIVQDARFRYTYSAYGQVETVKDRHEDRLVARYGYNYLGQRTTKTVFDTRGHPKETVLFLWVDDQLAAEIGPDGSIRSEYLYLDDGRRKMPIAKLDRSASGRAGIQAIHTDHRGAPVAMTNAEQSPVWRADLAPSGQATVREDTSASSAQLELRLPGQYRDAETGLHDNWHRTYDPGSGRYLQPDPLGYRDGPDAYAYAGADPVNRVDPKGLYQIDVHYYLTFFLGVTAGLDPDEARIVALAAQYVDDNPLTRPLDSTSVGTTIGSVFRNQRRLLNYHFVLSNAFGRTALRYRNSQLTHPDSPQLVNLLNAAHSNAVGPGGRLQFLGEYLHALADTYSHRDANDLPYDALVANCGVGHGHALHEPDLTYDDVHESMGDSAPGQPPPRESWRREARTLEMALNVHGVLVAFGDPAKASAPQAIEATVRSFNAIRESERTGSPADFPGKIGLLERELARLGYGQLNLRAARQFAYDVVQARQNRRAFLRGEAGEALTEEAFPGVCLEGGRRCGSG